MTFTSSCHERFMMPRVIVDSLKSMNPCCADCGECKPDWASLTFGTLVCLKCAGQHRALGVAVSVVRSLHMDDWSHNQIRRMQRGGNAARKEYFHEAHRKYIDQVTAEHKATSPKQLHLDFDNLTVEQMYDSNVGQAYERRLDAIVALEDDSGDIRIPTTAPPTFCLPPLQSHSPLYEVVDLDRNTDGRLLAKKVKGKYSTSHGYNFSANRGVGVGVSGKRQGKEFYCVPSILRSALGLGLRRAAAAS